MAGTQYYVIIHSMKQLSSALKAQKQQQSKLFNNKSRTKTKSELQKWSLDPDFVEEGLEGTKQKFKLFVCGIIKQKFESEKYLQEETFKDLITQLSANLPYISSELERLICIQETLQELRESFFGDIKNYVKHFESLLDARIRKLKKREKKAELIEFERMAALEGKMKRKNPVSFINEDQKPVKCRLKRKNMEEQRRESNSKRSFGTMNSGGSNSGGSNQNESESGKKSGSDSKSGEANALAVLLANVSKVDDKKKPKDKESQKQSYSFSSALSCTVTVRQRNTGSKHIYNSPSQVQKAEQVEAISEKQKQKDDAFIFHRPKQVRKGK